MSPSIISFPTILLISSLILISHPKHIVADTTTPSPLIRIACSNASINIDTELCLRLYPSIPRIAWAKDLFNLSLAIIETGVSYSTSALEHVEHVLNSTRAKSRARAAALRECRVAYGQVAKRFASAAREVRRGEYVAPTYELLTASTDCVNSCGEALESRRVGDEFVWRSGKAVAVFGLSAVTVIDQLDRPAPPPFH